MIPKDPFSFNPPDNEMVKGTGYVNAGFSGHENLLTKISLLGNLFFYGRPLFHWVKVTPAVHDDLGDQRLRIESNDYFLSA